MLHHVTPKIFLINIIPNLRNKTLLHAAKKKKQNKHQRSGTITNVDKNVQHYAVSNERVDIIDIVELAPRVTVQYRVFV